MGHLHQLRHHHLGKRQADEGAGADVLAARQLGAPVAGSSTSDSDGSGNSENGGTVLSVVYVTASPTFTGAIGGYSTLALGAPVQQSAKSSTSSLDDTFATTSSPSESESPVPSSQSTSRTTSTFSTMTSAIVTSATSLVTPVLQSSTIAGGPVAEGTASSTAQASPSTIKTGMSAGGKTGLAVGILLAVALVAAGVLLLYWRKKKAVEEEGKSHNEKAAFGADAAPMAGSLLTSPPPTTKLESSAPMLDLRPMSRLMPEFMGQRRSQGNLLNKINAPTAAATAGGADRSLTPPQESSAWERRAKTTDEKVENPFSDPSDPFGDEQAKAVSPSIGGPAAPAVSPNVPAPLNVRSPVPVAAAVAGATVAAVAAAKPTGSPAGSDSTTTPQADAIAGSGAPPNNVHAVHLDFKPSMEDEIGLRSGQLVRILHEYDDGWVSRGSPR
jgi:hypothetical protein